MLERATACLKVGARDSVHCAQRAPRSKRQLHSTFWNHGAADIELPPWAVGTYSANDKVARHDNRRRQSRSTSLLKDPDQRTQVPNPQSNGIYLEFLYPPQALAWMQRTNVQARERWEKGKARRLPDGFLQASRGFSSSRPARDVEPKGSSVEESFGSRPISGLGEASARDATPSVESATNRPGNTRQMVSELNSQPLESQYELARSEIPILGIRDVVEVTPDHPGDTIVPPEHEFTPVHNPLEILRRSIGGRPNSVHARDVRRIWFLYQSLDQSAKDDSRLKHELLLYMARLRDDTAASHTVTLFYALPTEARSLSDYEAAIVVHLRSGDYDAAFQVHRQALQNIPNGYQITRGFFQYAMRDRAWQHAVTIKEDHDEILSDSASANKKELFWLHVMEVPDLITKAFLFAAYCSRLETKEAEGDMMSDPRIGQGRMPSLEQSRATCTRLCQEAMRKVLPTPYRGDDDPQKTKIYRALDHIRKWDVEAPRLFLEYLEDLLRRFQRPIHYKGVHLLVSYMYSSYREIPGVKPPQKLLETLLARLLELAQTTRDPKYTTKNITYELIAADFKLYHGRLSGSAARLLMTSHARLGALEEVRKDFAYLQEQYPLYADQEDALWALIYVHARRGEWAQARDAFEEVQQMAAAHGAKTQLKWWNVLLHAYSRANKIRASLELLERLIVETDLIPEVQTFHPVLELLALRGDVDGIENLFEQFEKLNGGPHQTSFVGSYMRALIRSGEIQEAEQVLRKAVPDVRAHKITGSLTTCFNILLVAYARQRNIEATMQTYRWMKEERIRLDAQTFSALMLALVVYRQPDSAVTIMNNTMWSENLRPTAIHYAIAMHGFIQTRRFPKAISLHKTMLNKQVKPSLATRRLYLQAKARLEARSPTRYTSDRTPLPLSDVIAELRDAVGEADRADMANKDPFFNPGGGEDVLSSFASIIRIHGDRSCVEAVKQLLAMYKDAAKDTNDEPLPMRIISALMNAHFEAGNHDAVREYWNLARAEADRTAPRVSLPDFTLLATLEDPLGSVTVSEENAHSTSDHEDISAEIGFSAQAPPAPPAPTPAKTTAVAKPSAPSPGLDHILSTPLAYRMRSLSERNRIMDILDTFTSLVRQGYVFDIIAWNTLIQALCTAQPPLVLLAFTLTERYLIDQFPGWTTSKGARNYAPRPEPKRSGLQYIKGRYLPFDVIAPQYKTIVHLASALTRLKRIETMGGVRQGSDVARFVGNMKRVEESAPRTLRAVETLPIVPSDRLQQRLLGRQEGSRGEMYT
ncbi:unnamed protein product [Zymoseptoria tritici ST99CH_1A5]|uniref:Pentacotripeptide-repeat region of PRORP domain-containing protein n=1 Tax=Zymoseptoria tritici ST99CH_1A5 TaxID=1276529 RepID=A0A1Y6LVZ8_ZYMTR|nr:unnamed protein product [Zymoseptoria tritici ST99CH_1A5]